MNIYTRLVDITKSEKSYGISRILLLCGEFLEMTHGISPCSAITMLSSYNPQAYWSRINLILERKLRKSIKSHPMRTPNFTTRIIYPHQSLTAHPLRQYKPVNSEEYLLHLQKEASLLAEIGISVTVHKDEIR